MAEKGGNEWRNRAKQFTVPDLAPMVAQTIKERLELLGEIGKTEAQTGQINKQAALERREWLSLALRAIELWIK
jgi:hypothetical protein